MPLHYCAEASSPSQMLERARSDSRRPVSPSPPPPQPTRLSFNTALLQQQESLALQQQQQINLLQRQNEQLMQLQFEKAKRKRARSPASYQPTTAAPYRPTEHAPKSQSSSNAAFGTIGFLIAVRALQCSNKADMPCFHPYSQQVVAFGWTMRGKLCIVESAFRVSVLRLAFTCTDLFCRILDACPCRA